MIKRASFVAIALVTIASAFVSAEERYTVLRGDNLSKIGRQFGISHEEIMAANNLKHTHIYEGQVLKIPRKGEVVVTGPSGNIRIKPPPTGGAVDRYRAPGLIPSPEIPVRGDVTETSRVGTFSGELPIDPLPPEPPSVYVKPVAKTGVPSHSYPPPSQERYSTPDAPGYLGVSPYNHSPSSTATASTPVSGRTAQKKPVIKRPTRTVRCVSRAGTTYVVKRGDSVRSISNKFRVNFWSLRTANNIQFKRIYPGQVLRIPNR